MGKGEQKYSRGKLVAFVIQAAPEKEARDSRDVDKSSDYSLLKVQAKSSNREPDKKNRDK